MSDGEAEPSAKPNEEGTKPSIGGERVRALYQETPYPVPNEYWKASGAPLPPLAWINAVARPGNPVAGRGSRILVAGCGTGAEAFRYAAACPEATVVGVDFSDRSIAIALEVAEKEKIENVSFAVADLSKRDLADRLEPFDFISLHGVLDYIPHAAAALQSLQEVMVEEGCLYLGVNGPGHNGWRYRLALNDFGLESDQYHFSDEDRDRIAAIEVLMACHSDDSVAQESETYLASDIFSSQNHSHSIDNWIELASSADLHLLTSLDLTALLPNSESKVLRYLMAHDRATLSRLTCTLQDKSFMRLLLLKQPRPEPKWTDLDDLTQWYPRVEEKIRHSLPSPKGNWEEPQPLLIEFPGLGKRRIRLSPACLAFLRDCEGHATALQIWAGLSTPANWADLVTQLFRLYHAGLFAWNGQPASDASTS